jgi:hypothetical protein
MKTAVEWLINHIDIKSIDNTDKYIEKAKEIEENLAEQFAEFSILCDRRGMKPIKFKDWCEQYNKKTI